MKAVILAAGVAVAFAAPALAQAQLIPGYIRAQPAPLAKAYSPEIARRVFSGEFTPLRQAKIIPSTRNVPGLTCPAAPKVLLFNVTPYRFNQKLVSWIEQYVVDCNERRIRRSLLMVLEKDKVQAFELMRGATNTDPLLQRDAKGPVMDIVAAKAAPDCKAVDVYDSAVTQKPDSAALWVERWEVTACGTLLKVDVTFMPSPRGGTTWSAKLVPLSGGNE